VRRIVILILVFLPDTPACRPDVFTEPRQQHRWTSTAARHAGIGLAGSTSLPLGFLLTQYTITGYDASAHLSEETRVPPTRAAKGIWKSIFYSAIGGWILLLAFLFAVRTRMRDGGRRRRAAVIFAAGPRRRTMAGYRPADLGDRPAVLHHGLH